MQKTLCGAAAFEWLVGLSVALQAQRVHRLDAVARSEPRRRGDHLRGAGELA